MWSNDTLGELILAMTCHPHRGELRRNERSDVRPRNVDSRSENFAEDNPLQIVDTALIGMHDTTLM